MRRRAAGGWRSGASGRRSPARRTGSARWRRRRSGRCRAACAAAARQSTSPRRGHVVADHRRDHDQEVHPRLGQLVEIASVRVPRGDDRRWRRRRPRGRRATRRRRAARREVGDVRCGFHVQTSGHCVESGVQLPASNAAADPNLRAVKRRRRRGFGRQHFKARASVTRDATRSGRTAGPRGRSARTSSPASVRRPRRARWRRPPACGAGRSARRASLGQQQGQQQPRRPISIAGGRDVEANDARTASMSAHRHDDRADPVAEVQPDSAASVTGSSAQSSQDAVRR